MLRKLMVVDDNAKLLNAVRLELSDRFDVLTAGPEHPCSQALEKWQLHPDLDLALVDLKMPRNGGPADQNVGLDLIEELRRLRPSAKIAAYTAYSSTFNRARAFGGGADDFVMKAPPTNPLESPLSEVVERLCAGQTTVWLNDRRGIEPVSGPTDGDATQAWCLADAEIRRRFGGQVVAACGTKIWGFGDDIVSALRKALDQPDHPPQHLLTFVPIPPSDFEAA